MRNECGNPCRTIRYLYTDHAFRPKNSPKDRFVLYMDPHVMSYKSITETKAMTFDMLVANVGGILGLFLGISFVTLTSAVQYIIKKGVEIYSNKFSDIHNE